MDKFNDAEHLRLLLFMMVRNSVVSPVASVLRKPVEEVNKMAYGVMLRLIDTTDFDTMCQQTKKAYLQGKELFEKDKS